MAITEAPPNRFIVIFIESDIIMLPKSEKDIPENNKMSDLARNPKRRKWEIDFSNR